MLPNMTTVPIAEARALSEVTLAAAQVVVMAPNANEPVATRKACNQ